mmetsp:Transcript_33173/g.43692  ORF Transcript_33173/g.43692 Transcript_33173/m.43692 type:complete len:84 (-) Transcript_33173:36-287(-)
MVAHLAKHAEDTARGENRLRTILVTMGADGVLICNVGDSEGEQAYVHVPAEAVPTTQIKSVVGAGDCFMAGFIAGLLRQLPSR